jgi:hypothetical protein
MDSVQYEWAGAVVDMEDQMSQTEDQIEEDFWHRRFDPHRVLWNIQRLSLRLERYIDNVRWMETPLKTSRGTRQWEAMKMDADDAAETLDALAR